MKLFIGCSSRPEIDKKYIEDADFISKKLASYGYDLIIGGIDVDCTYVENTFEREARIYNEASKVLILPGGTGSLAELFSMLEDNRTIKCTKEIIIYNQDGYYYDLIKFITKLIREKFNDYSILNYIKIFNEKEDLIKYLEV